MQMSTPQALIAQISDLHIKPVGQRAYQRLIAYVLVITENTNLIPTRLFVTSRLPR